MRVLIVDDDAAVRQAVRATLEEEENRWEVEEQSFDGAGEALVRFRPDMLVLDLVEGEGADGRASGNPVFEEIVGNWFCPVVVYSAFPGQQDFNHPLVKTVTKGADTELQVRERLADFVPHAEMVRSVHQDFDARIREALRDSVQALTEQSGATEGAGGGVVLPRAVRRLVAARADAEAGEGKLLAWERFVLPPLGTHLLTADLLSRKIEQPAEEDFRLVLTPSCDLVPRSDGLPEADRIVVACCERIERLGKVELAGGQALSNKARENLRPILTEGIGGHFLPIPEFRSYVPPMVANLKRLELLEWEEVELDVDENADELPEDHKFRRVASTDSPFREMVVWAYLRVTGRPGLPAMDVDKWLDSLSDHLASRDQL